ncbi:MAG: hypothetical protein KBT02_03720 [Treponema sp.]|nr:hypothetical protein [Candidatus Treponema caballi]
MSSTALKNTSEEELSPKVRELRLKIHDENYINNAIQRIAVVLSRRIVEKPQNLKEVVNGSY